MINTIVTKVKEVLTNPVEAFRQSRNDEPRSVFTYFGVLLLFNAIMCSLIAAIGMAVIPMPAAVPLGTAFPVIVFFMMLVGGCIGTLILAAWLHLWVYILGGRKGIMQTVNAVIYGSTPRLLLGWIPFLGIIFALWALVLKVIGVRELQELSTAKAILVFVIAIAIPLIIIILLAAWLYTSVMTVTAVPVPPTNLI